MRNRIHLLGLSLIALLALSAPARAQILIERVVTVGKTVADGGTLVSALTWSDANLSSVSWVAVSLNFSSPYASTNPMQLGDLSSVLRFGTTSDVGGITQASVFTQGNLASSSQTFELNDNFDGAWKASNRWELRVTDNIAGGIAKLDTWKLSVLGQANSTGTLTLKDGEKISTATDSSAETTVGSVLSLTGTTDAQALANKTLTLSGGLSGSGVLQASADAGGKVVLSGNSTNFTGTVKVAGSGITEIADARALGGGLLQQSNSQSTLRLNFAGSMTNRLSVYNVSFGTNGATLAGNVTVNNADIDVASGDTNTISGFVDGSGTITKLGGGTLVLSGTTNGYTGITDVRNGTLRAVTVADSSASSSIGAGTNLTIGSSNNAGTFVHTATDTTNSMNREVLVGSAGGTFSVEHSNSRVTLTGNVANQTSGATNTTLTKSGAGTLAFGSGANVSVSTIAIQQGTLLLGAANTIGESTAITLAAGTTLNTAGYADAVGKLTVNGASTIQGLEAVGGSDFTFSNIDLGTYAGGGGSALTFLNSGGTSYGLGTVMRLSSSPYTSWTGYSESSFNSFQSKISFSDANLQGQINFSGGYTTLTVAAIPEPKVYIAAGTLALLIGCAEFRRRKRAKSAA